MVVVVSVPLAAGQFRAMWSRPDTTREERIIGGKLRISFVPGFYSVLLFWFADFVLPGTSLVSLTGPLYERDIPN